MSIVGMLRVRNEARWIERVIASIQPLCAEIFVMDDHSDDGTAELAAAMERVTVLPSPFEGLNEVRDKNWLLDQIRPTQADWVLQIDGDEELMHEDRVKLQGWMNHTQTYALSLRVLYLWDSERVVRTDGVYGRMRRPSAFRLFGAGKFQSSSANGFHCSNVPANFLARCTDTQVRLLHYGYLHQADRIRKYEWYNATDPGNTREDHYRHVVQGDVPGILPSMRLLHAGPMTFSTLP